VKVFCNTTPFIALASIDRLELLHQVLGDISVAEAVVQDLTLRCYAEQQDRCLWVAVCVDLGLAAQGETYKEARQKLKEQIKAYVVEKTFALHGETVTVPERCPYSLEQVLAPDFFPDSACD